MPSLSFVMPHWLYWCGLVLFPAIAIYFVRRQLRSPPGRGPSLFIAYVFWLCSGFLGIHRFYLRSGWGVVFIPFFLAILYCNAQLRDTREDDSRTLAAMTEAQVAVGQARTSANSTPEEVAAAKQAGETLKTREQEYKEARANNDHWNTVAHVMAGVLALMLLVDAALLPGLVRRRDVAEKAQPTLEVEHAEPPAMPGAGTGEDPTMYLHSRYTDAVEQFNGYVGEYVAFWAIMSVFVYYYEVIARFVFNSPTNWVHESMFLMFGMQYMLCGAYAYREDQHVRVDVVYSKFSRRGKAIADIITSVFFFIFIGTMFWTSARFALDSIQYGEHSFTEWGIQYWPVKLTMPIGAAMLLLQGVCRLIKDILIVTHREA